MKADYIKNFLDTVTSRKIDIGFIIVFFVFLFVPMMKISDAEVSENEKRVLAKYPNLFMENQFNKNFTSEFDTWFSDRFNGRKKLIRLHSKLKKKIDSAGSDPRVLYGEEGWLFYKGDNSLDNFQNKTIFTDEELKIIAKYLSGIDAWAKQNGKSFYYLIAPDKNKIYGEYITSLKKIRQNEDSRANQLVRYLKENTTVNVIYPYQSLLKNKEKGLLYYKQDTHWNDFGAYLAYKELMETIKNEHRNVSSLVASKNKKILHERGDLSQMINYAIAKDESEYLEPEIIDYATCVYNSDDKDETKGLKCKNNQKKIRMITFRDSFSSALKRYYNNTFGVAKYEWRWNITAQDLESIKKNFDIIILETVERYIPSLLPLKFPED